jgi:SAM-dependent methyltransferase
VNGTTEMSRARFLEMSPQEAELQFAAVFGHVTEPLLSFDAYPASWLGQPMFAKMGFSASYDRYLVDYGHVLLTRECVDALAAVLAGKRVIDVGSGTGFLSYCLKTAGIDVTALDLPTLGSDAHRYFFRQIWALDIADDFSSHLPGNFDVVILSWPDIHTAFAHNVARAMRPGQVLVYQGEPAGGCNANSSFFAYIEGPGWEPLKSETVQLARYHRRFPGLNDVWMVLRKTGGSADA